MRIKDWLFESFFDDIEDVTNDSQVQDNDLSYDIDSFKKRMGFCFYIDEFDKYDKDELLNAWKRIRYMLETSLGIIDFSAPYVYYTEYDKKVIHDEMISLDDYDISYMHRYANKNNYLFIIMGCDYEFKNPLKAFYYIKKLVNTCDSFDSFNKNFLCNQIFITDSHEDDSETLFIDKFDTLCGSRRATFNTCKFISNLCSHRFTVEECYQILRYRDDIFASSKYALDKMVFNKFVAAGRGYKHYRLDVGNYEKIPMSQFDINKFFKYEEHGALMNDLQEGGVSGYFNTKMMDKGDIIKTCPNLKQNVMKKDDKYLIPSVYIQTRGKDKRYMFVTYTLSKSVPTVDEDTHAIVYFNKQSASLSIYYWIAENLYPLKKFFNVDLDYVIEQIKRTVSLSDEFVEKIKEYLVKLETEDKN